jgi:hypothetical protein
VLISVGLNGVFFPLVTHGSDFLALLSATGATPGARKCSDTIFPTIFFIAFDNQAIEQSLAHHRLEAAAPPGSLAADYAWLIPSSAAGFLP